MQKRELDLIVMSSFHFSFSTFTSFQVFCDYKRVQMAFFRPLYCCTIFFFLKQKRFTHRTFNEYGLIITMVRPMLKFMYHKVKHLIFQCTHVITA